MQIVNQNDPNIKVTFGDTVTYRGTPNLDRIGTIEPDDKRTAASGKLWLVKWKGDTFTCVEHECNLARVDDVADVRIQNEGSIFVAHLDSIAAREWVEANVGLEGAQWWGKNGLVVEHRFIGDITEGMLAAGLEVE